MNEQAIEAVKERVLLGHGREEIVAELLAAGYPAEAATDLYEEVLRRESISATPPNSVPVTPAAPWIAKAPASSPAAEVPPVTPGPITASQATPRPAPTGLSNADVIDGVILTEVSTNKSHLVLIVILVLGGVLLSAGLVYGAVFGGFQKAGDFFSSLLQSAPYTTEAEMMTGLITGSRSLNAYGFNVDYELALEPRAPETPTLENIPPEVLDEKMEVYSETLSEGHMLLTSSGIVDLRDNSNRKFDVSTTINVLVEPIIMNAAGSVRLVDGNVYGRIDDIPANFKMFIPDELPLGTWILLYEENDNSGLPVKPIMLPTKAQQVLSVASSTLARMYYGEIERLFTLSQDLAAKSAGYAKGQLASGAAALGLDVTGMGEEERLMLEKSLELLQKYPVFSFVGEPEPIKAGEEKLYQYAVDVNYDNLRSYLMELMRESEAITGKTTTVMPNDLDDLLPNREAVDEFNRLSDIVFTFRGDGSIAAFDLNGVFTIDHPDVTNQLRFGIGLELTRQNDATDIVIPNDVHPKTLQEIMEKQMEKQIEMMESGECTGGPICESLLEARQRGREASIKQTLNIIRSQAEISYNNSNFSYKDVCIDENIQKLLVSIGANYQVKPSVHRDGVSGPGTIVCNDDDTEYAVIAPLLDSEQNLSYCVDSTGYIGEVSPYVLKSKTDATCQ